MSEDQVRLKVVREPTGKLGLEPVESFEPPEPTPEDDNENYSNMEDGFGGRFLKEELGESSKSEPSTPPTMNPEQELKKKAIMLYLRKTHTYRDIEVTDIRETSSGNIIVSGHGISNGRFSDRRLPFQTTFSKWSVEQVLKRLKDSEGDHGVIYHG